MSIDAAPVGPGFFMDEGPSAWNGTDAVFEDTAVESYGAIGPIAYYTGGLRARASDTGVFGTAATAAWTDVEAMTFTGRTKIQQGLTTAWGAATPAGAGLTDADTFTLAHDGEIYLEAGTWTFYLLADDHAFLDLAAPGSASFSRVASADWPTEGQGTFVVAADGWHPVHLASSEGTGNASLQLQHSGPGVSARADVSRQRLRFRADALTGLALSGFDDAYLLAATVVTVDDVAPANADWAAGAPTDLGLTDADYFATRWSGQVRIEAAGAYTFRCVSDDGHRMWIDGVQVLDAWDESSHDNTTNAVTLERGWHDIVIDQLEGSGAARAQLTVASGPEGAGAALPVERLRPVVTRRERVESGVDRTDRAIPDNGTVASTIALDAPVGAKAGGIEVAWTFDHTYQGDLEIRLRAPDGTAVLLRDNTGGAGTGSVTQRMYVTALADATAAGTWRLEVKDTVGLDTGTLRDFELTVHYRGGSPPIPLYSSYTSPVKDLGAGVTALDSMSWSARLAAGTSVQVRVRTGASPDAVAAAPWSTPMVDAAGSEPAALPAQYLQYKVELTSDGDGAPAIDWVRLEYSTESE